MKSTFFVFSAIFLFGLCSFSLPVEESQFLPTKLRITVLDGLGNTTEGVIVKIYKNQEDYRTGENELAQSTTDSKGRVNFTDLEPIHYFIDARKGDMNNDGEGVRTAKLKEGRLNKVNTVVE